MSLAFAANGKQAFAVLAPLPAVAVAERSHSAPSVAEIADAIRQELREALIATMQ